MSYLSGLSYLNEQSQALAEDEFQQELNQTLALLLEATDAETLFDNFPVPDNKLLHYQLNALNVLSVKSEDVLMGEFTNETQSIQLCASALSIVSGQPMDNFINVVPDALVKGAKNLTSKGAKFIREFFTRLMTWLKALFRRRTSATKNLQTLLKAMEYVFRTQKDKPKVKELNESQQKAVNGLTETVDFISQLQKANVDKKLREITRTFKTENYKAIIPEVQDFVNGIGEGKTFGKLNKVPVMKVQSTRINRLNNRVYQTPVINGSVILVAYGQDVTINPDVRVMKSTVKADKKQIGLEDARNYLLEAIRYNDNLNAMSNTIYDSLDAGTKALPRTKEIPTIMDNILAFKLPFDVTYSFSTALFKCGYGQVDTLIVMLREYLTRYQTKK